jgi:hypothetical protein
MICHVCQRPGFWKQRIAIPVKGSKEIERYAITGHTFCPEHRKAGVKALDLLTSEWQAFITDSMKPLEPDFARAFLEWAP